MINRLEFSIDINAEKSAIWKALWDENAYLEWVNVFMEGSYVVADNWEEGSKVHFLGPDQNGIYSIIKTHIPNKIIKFEHIGNVIKGNEQPIDSETKKWSGATEVYKLNQGINNITLSVEIDILDEHLEFMANTFPKALKIVKNNCR